MTHEDPDVQYLALHGAKNPKKPTVCLRALSECFLNSGWLGVQCPFLESADLFLHHQASCNSPTRYKNELFCGSVTDACMCAIRQRLIGLLCMLVI